MAEKVCLDTDVCIAVLKGETRAEIYRGILDYAELFVSPITVFELYLRKGNLGKLNNLLNNLLVLYFDERCAIKASDIYKELEKMAT